MFQVINRCDLVCYSVRFLDETTTHWTEPFLLISVLIADLDHFKIPPRKVIWLERKRICKGFVLIL